MKIYQKIKLKNKKKYYTKTSQYTAKNNSFKYLNIFIFFFEIFFVSLHQKKMDTPYDNVYEKKNNTNR